MPSVTSRREPASRKRGHEESGEEEEEAEEAEEGQFSQFHLAELATPPKSSCSGIVERLYLRNFMCHDALEVTFNPRINFVVGRNGSGKSAVLLGLVVGLGGKASATNRGNSLKSFVKKGEKAAVVEVTLKNDGLYPYKAELYGNKITVVRTILATGAGGGYKIKSASGLIVTTRRIDLMQLLESHKIQVDNPVAVLNQDTSRNFLKSTDAGDMYNLFMRATQMDFVISDHEKARETRAQASAALNEKSVVMSQQEKLASNLEARCKALKSVPEQRRRIEDLENQIVWAQVLDKEAELVAAESVVEAESRKEEELKMAADGQGMEDDMMKEQHRSLQQRLAELRERLKSEEMRFQEARDKHKAQQRLMQAAQLDKRMQMQQVKRKQENKMALIQEIQRLEQSTEPDYLVRRTELRQRTVRCAEQLAQVEAANQTSELHCTQLRDNEEPLREKIHTLRSEQNLVKRKVENIERNLSTLSRSSSVLSLYGQYAVPLQERIDAAVNRREFSRPPVGPLGRHVRLRSGQENWASAIEQQLGAMLQAYLVNSTQDRAKLFKLMTEVIGNRRKPTVINSRFQATRHNVAPNCVFAPNGSKAMLDVIVVDDVQAFNALVDSIQIEKILLIPTLDLALDMMQRKQTVPRNCSRGVLPNGDLFYPAPDYRTFAGRRGYTTRFLQVSTADRVKDLEAMLVPERELYETYRKRVEELNAQLAELSAEVRRANEERDRLKRTKQRIRIELAQLRDAEEPEESSISTLAAELVVCEEELVAVGNAEQAAQERLDAASAEVDAAKMAARELCDQLKELGQTEAPLVAEMQRIRGDLTASTAAKQFSEGRLRDQLTALKVAQDAANAVRREAEQLAENALLIVPRLEPTASMSVLNDERRRLEAALNSLVQDQGDYLQVYQDYQQVKVKLDSVKGQVNATGALLKRLSKIIKERASRYENVRRLVSWVVTHYFHLRLKQRKYTGELIFDHAAKTLSVEVVPSHRCEGDSSKDPHSLSGGERSYSTVVFIMALWDAIELPFYFMDEFDVFMDNVNRKVIMSMLMEHAKQRHGRQFVFLTPQDVASVATDKDVSIYRMEDPRD